MSDRLHVFTRKGLFTIRRGTGGRGNGARGGWAIAGNAFLGDPVSMFLRDARDGAMYAALNLGHFGVKVHRSEDEGKTWKEIATPAYPAAPTDAEGKPDEKAAALVQVWCLEEAGKDRPGGLWCGTLPGGLFYSGDRGESWRLIESLWNRPERKMWFGGGYDTPGIHSVSVDPRDSRKVFAGVSCGGVWFTADAGESWECRATGMFAAYMPDDRKNDPNIQDPHRVAMCAAKPECLWAQHHNGVFRTTDGGKQWREVANVPPSVFGFAVCVHPKDAETAWLAPAIKDEKRIPVDGKVVVSRTRDGGRTVDVLRKGLPQENAYHLVYRHAMDVDARGERLALGSTTGGLWISEDQGDSWECVSRDLPPVYGVRWDATP